jgi:hypothetical protein
MTEPVVDERVEQTDNGVRPEDGVQDVDQEPRFEPEDQ